MLLNPHHDKQLTLASFALFVAGKDPREKYNWRNCYQCACAQWLMSMDRQNDYFEWSGEVELANELARGAYRCGCDDYDNLDWTFGALADRILAYQRAQHADAA